jgi:protein-serine/threonine kinase
MFKFGSMGRKFSQGNGSVNGTGYENWSPSASTKTEGSGAQWSPNQSNSSTQLPPLNLHTAPATMINFRPIAGSTVVADPASFSNDSMSSDGVATGSSHMDQLTSSSIATHKDQRLGDEVRLPSVTSHLQPAVEVLEGDAGSPQLAPPLITSLVSSGGFASKLVRRVSSAPDHNKLLAKEAAGGHQRANKASNGEANEGQKPAEGEGRAVDAEPNAAFFPGSPVRMDSSARSFSSKDFEKGRSVSGKSFSSNGTPKSKGVLSFPGSRKSSGSAKSGLPENRNQILGTPSTAGAMASLQSGSEEKPASAIGGPARATFRRTYSSNSIKVREVEVGPNSFTKVKMLGKGDVGKVYLVREKKTEKLFAMKGEFAREAESHLLKQPSDSLTPCSPLKERDDQAKQDQASNGRAGNPFDVQSSLHCHSISFLPIGRLSLPVHGVLHGRRVLSSASDKAGKVLGRGRCQVLCCRSHCCAGIPPSDGIHLSGSEARE